MLRGAGATAPDNSRGCHWWNVKKYRQMESLAERMRFIINATEEFMPLTFSFTVPTFACGWRHPGNHTIQYVPPADLWGRTRPLT